MKTTLSLLLAVSCAAAAFAACGNDGTFVRFAGPDASAPLDATPPGPEASAIERGAFFVVQRKCPDCHQASDAQYGTLTGQTDPQPGTSAFPANLSPDPDTGMDGWSEDLIVRAMRTGVDDQGAPLCAPMPRFADMSDDEAKAIAAYLKSLPPVHHAIPDSLCPPVKPAPDAGAQDAALDAASAVDAGTLVDGSGEAGG